MTCNPEVLKQVPLFALLDQDETALLATKVELKNFAPRQRIYKMGEPGGRAYVVVSGKARVTTVDQDHQEVVIDEPTAGDFFGFASMLQQSPHETAATAIQETVCVEVDRDDIFELIQRKPHAAMDMLSVLGRQYHAAHQLVRGRSMRNINEVIEEEATFGDRVADSVARFGGSWKFIITFGLALAIYTTLNVWLKGSAWDPYPFILLNLFLSMLAAVQAPVIMMSQNRQDTKDRLRGELDFEVNKRAEAEIQGVAGKIHELTEKMEDLEELVRSQAR